MTPRLRYDTYWDTRYNRPTRPALDASEITSLNNRVNCLLNGRRIWESELAFMGRIDVISSCNAISCDNDFHIP